MSKIRRKKKNKTRSERRAKKENISYGDPTLYPKCVGPGEQAHRFFLNIQSRMLNANRIIDYHEYWHQHYHELSGKKKKIMNIAVVQEDGTENEFELEMCCAECATRIYGWTANQFNKILQMNDPVKIPDNITTAEQFRQFVKTL
jgi:hypothetical protein